MEIRVPVPDEAEMVAETLLRPFYRTEEEHDAEYHTLDHEWVDEAGIESWLEEADHAIFVAEATDGDPAGLVAGRRSEQPPLFDRDPVLVVDGVYVVPEYRSQGLAHRLLDRIEDWGREHGCAHVGLTAHANNDAAIALYESRDYEFVYRGYHREL